MATQVSYETKPAPKTTEFWFHVLLQILFFLNTSHAWTYMSPRYSALAQAVIFAAYTISRGEAKKNITYTETNS